ncbi:MULTISPECIES: hypothetical protein [Spongiibacter]|jgi:hypothetical protein|uniref:hypothetical protein n=1 Tax=Spongiibacter TaxID=630749 RepID=UPI001B0C3F09|nr:MULTISPECIES: hypothetical protein [Spongiibacter]MBO6752144.1 hypothetical protein [Spongiibacter sp.]|tara:strand:- start:5349 stop:5759 length:411 start_codon:yes stop_codon:yes gene_type:complete
MRGYIRHPDAIPVEVVPVDNDMLPDSAELPGLCCRVERPFARGSAVRFTLPSMPVDFTGIGRISCCCRHGDSWLARISLSSEQALYHLRMVEQLCQIEAYRHCVSEHQGRQLNAEQAAAEWISRYAADFDQYFAMS